MIAVRRRRWLLGAAAGAAALVLGGVALAQVSGGAYNLSWNDILGGGTSANGSFSLQGGIGQPVAGSASQAQFALNAGFLPGLAGGKYRGVLPQVSKDGTY